jgi:hypothetical protein
VYRSGELAYLEATLRDQNGSLVATATATARVIEMADAAMAV